jgi:DNA-binding NtrC family response regulator
MAIQNAIKVFVVDDEKVICDTLAIILNKSGFVATAFTDPLEALKTASTDSPDLLISDVIMPGLTGVELAVRLKAICPECKVLLFSGQAATLDLLDAARENGHDFTLLSKPVHPTDLLNAIRKLSG